jgi:hypothetical protein
LIIKFFLTLRFFCEIAQQKPDNGNRVILLEQLEPWVVAHRSEAVVLRTYPTVTERELAIKLVT